MFLAALKFFSSLCRSTPALTGTKVVQTYHWCLLYVDVTGARGGVTIACQGRGFASPPVVTDCAVSAARCGCPASVSVRLRPSSVASGIRTVAARNTC